MRPEGFDPTTFCSVASLSVFLLAAMREAVAR
jgi:hypothetical protein